MRITAITIENFKGISAPVRVELKPITLLFGANSVGKSTIVQALHYVREILERNNVDADRCLGADESMDLGGFRNLLYNHDVSKSIKIRIEIALNENDLPDYMTTLVDGPSHTKGISNYSTNFVGLTSVWIELEMKYEETLETPYVYSYTVGSLDAPYARITNDILAKNVKISYLNTLHPSLRITEGFFGEKTDVLADLYNSLAPTNISNSNVFNDIVFDKKQAFPLNWDLPLELPWSFYTDASERSESIDDSLGNDVYENVNKFNENKAEFECYVSQLIVGPGKLLLDLLKQSRYIGPIRKIPPRGYAPPRYADEARWASGLAAWDLLQKSNPELVSDTSDWLSRKDRLNSGYSLRVLRFKKLDMASDLYAALVAKGAKGEAAMRAMVAELPEEKHLLLTDERRGLDVLPQDVGIGISQILPVVVGSLDDETSILMVEQPELHIHPGLQCNLGDLFISQIQKEGKTFLIETHSEHLLLRLLRRIRENNDNELPEGVVGLTPEQVSVNYVELTEDGLRIRPLHISEDGDSLGEWPRGFFEERAKELL